MAGWFDVLKFKGALAGIELGAMGQKAMNWLKSGTVFGNNAAVLGAGLVGLGALGGLIGGVSPKNTISGGVMGAYSGPIAGGIKGGLMGAGIGLAAGGIGRALGWGSNLTNAAKYSGIAGAAIGAGLGFLKRTAVRSNRGANNFSGGIKY